MNLEYKCGNCGGEINTAGECLKLECIHSYKILSEIIQGCQYAICGVVYSPYVKKCSNFHGIYTTKGTTDFTIY